MRRVLAFVSAAAAGFALARLLTTRRRRPEPVEPELDPRAAELRDRLAESREAAEEADSFEAGETPVEAEEPSPADPDERRRRVHDEGRAAIEKMHGGAAPQ